MQFRINGFTFNRLKPYTSWGDILPQVKDLWSLYIDIASPESITRIAVRYINNIEIPKPDNIVFSDYLKVPPKIPDNPYNIPFRIPKNICWIINIKLTKSFVMVFSNH